MKRMNVKVVLALSLVLLVATIAFAKGPKPIVTDEAPAAVGPYSQGIKYGELVFISGQLPLDPLTGLIPQYYNTATGRKPCLYDTTTKKYGCPVPSCVCADGNITEQTQQVMENLGAILAEAKLSFDDVLMTTVYLEDINEFNGFNYEYGKTFGCEYIYPNWHCDPDRHPPARATIAVGKYIPPTTTVPGDGEGIPKGAKLEVSMIAGK
jgi:2-iminobutanoate/2-iminopropanoate deaminase